MFLLNFVARHGEVQLILQCEVVPGLTYTVFLQLHKERMNYTPPPPQKQSQKTASYAISLSHQTAVPTTALSGPERQ